MNLNILEYSSVECVKMKANTLELQSRQPNLLKLKLCVSMQAAESDKMHANYKEF